MPKHDFSKVRISKSLKQNPPSRPDLRLGTCRHVFIYLRYGKWQKRACVPNYFDRDCLKTFKLAIFSTFGTQNPKLLLKLEENAMFYFSRQSWTKCFGRKAFLAKIKNALFTTFACKSTLCSPLSIFLQLFSNLCLHSQCSSQQFKLVDRIPRPFFSK